MARKKKNTLICKDCDAEYTISHSMDEEYYKALFCPFCGYEIKDEEDRYEEDDIDEQEEGYDE